MCLVFPPSDVSSTALESILEERVVRTREWQRNSASPLQRNTVSAPAPDFNRDNQAVLSEAREPGDGFDCSFSSLSTSSKLLDGERNLDSPLAVRFWRPSVSSLAGKSQKCECFTEYLHPPIGNLERGAADSIIRVSDTFSPNSLDLSSSVLSCNTVVSFPPPFLLPLFFFF